MDRLTKLYFRRMAALAKPTDLVEVRGLFGWVAVPIAADRQDLNDGLLRPELPQGAR